MSTMLQATLNWVLKNKVITFLGVCLFSFIVALIAVSVKKDNYLSDLTTCQNMLDNLTQTTTEKDTSISVSTTMINTTENPLAKTVKQVYRLPAHVIPTRYKIQLHPHLQNDDNIFEGLIDIHLEIIEPTEEIILHAKNLTVKQIDLFKNESNIPIVFNIAEDDTEFLHIKSNLLLQMGHYDLKIHYFGSLEGIVGFYSSKINHSKFRGINQLFYDALNKYISNLKSFA